MTLFSWGKFQSNSGAELDWKIECDALTDADWHCLARAIAGAMPPFGEVLGVPTGGLKLAAALAQLATKGSDVLLLADDVLTTGGSMRRLKEQFPGRKVMGAVAFARGPAPRWIFPVFTLSEWRDSGSF